MFHLEQRRQFGVGERLDTPLTVTETVSVAVTVEDGCRDDSRKDRRQAPGTK
jgi:hypothetical protein